MLFTRVIICIISSCFPYMASM
uniref:Uncharacterized protein n=1 Tax=Anguilla anguilla TaxID=7936 RepID=A0A0E9SG01_ANGAN